MSTHFDLSEELATFLDLESTNVPRHQIIRKVCEYVRNNQLVDDDNKIVYRCDNELHHFIKKDTFAAFSIIRDLEEHVTPVIKQEKPIYQNSILFKNTFDENQLAIGAYILGNKQMITINNFTFEETILYDYLEHITSKPINTTDDDENQEEDNQEEKENYMKLQFLCMGFFFVTICSLWLAILFGNFK